eukprot:4769744-Amphidinium_carterae.1
MAPSNAELRVDPRSPHTSTLGQVKICSQCLCSATKAHVLVGMPHTWSQTAIFVAKREGERSNTKTHILCRQNSLHTYS